MKISIMVSQIRVSQGDEKMLEDENLAARSLGVGGCNPGWKIIPPPRLKTHGLADKFDDKISAKLLCPLANPCLSLLYVLT